MKLRVQGNSIRFRLTRREVAEFVETGRASARVEFGPNSFLVYTLTADDAVDKLTASFKGGEVVVRIAGKAARDWALGDMVSLESAQDTGSNQVLIILIEKDFQCMHKGEDAKDPEAYPNPMALSH